MTDDGPVIIDFDWILFVGHCLLNFTAQEVGFMTLRRWKKLYKFYQTHHDFTTKRGIYSELEGNSSGDEWLAD